jgi:hypothetical protein
MPIVDERLLLVVRARGVSRNTSSNCFCVDAFINGGAGCRVSGVGC